MIPFGLYKSSVLYGYFTSANCKYIVTKYLLTYKIKSYICTNDCYSVVHTHP